MCSLAGTSQGCRYVAHHTCAAKLVQSMPKMASGFMMRQMHVNSNTPSIQWHIQYLLLRRGGGGSARGTASAANAVSRCAARLLQTIHALHSVHWQYAQNTAAVEQIQWAANMCCEPPS
jgi:hypothetical protein